MVSEEWTSTGWLRFHDGRDEVGVSVRWRQDRSTNTILTEEGRSEDTHRAILAMGHTALAAKQFAENALDGTTHDGEGMATVRSMSRTPSDSS